MASDFSLDRIRFNLSQLRNHLWVRPLLVCLLSIAAAFLAKLADDTSLATLLPQIKLDAVETLLSIMASSMLVIATFSVASMLSAYSSASRTATPRSFNLVVSDDASQNALSTFVGAFIYSTVALIAVKNDYFESAGLFILFVITVLVFCLVIAMFVRWVDRIARLGRMESTIEKVEAATLQALQRRIKKPALGGVPLQQKPQGKPISSKTDNSVVAKEVGFIQHIDMSALQACAQEQAFRVKIACLPGTFTFPGRVLAYINKDEGEPAEDDYKRVLSCFKVKQSRAFDDDPRFGLVVLSEIASRALSPAVNDPGTAISVIGSLLRLFSVWSDRDTNTDEDPKCDRIEVPLISTQDMFDDAFKAIGRDGAGMVEVAMRLQKALYSLSQTRNSDVRDAAEYHRQLALKRSQRVLDIEEDIAAVKDAAQDLKHGNS